jgi:PAS domain S-box-containing protein
MKILIVEDNEQNLYLLEMMLKGYGYEVVSAKNGVEALNNLRKDNFNLIISDILMPKMDGFQLCRECKKDDKLKNITFIFYTATYTEKEDEEFAISLGASRFIVKPAEPEVFIGMLKEVIQESEEGVIKTPVTPIIREPGFRKRYTERVVKKLEKKILQLEDAKKALKEEITGRKQAEETLRESEERYRHVVENATNIIYTTDTNGNYQFANSACLRLSGYTLNELQKLNYLDLVVPEYRRRTQIHYMRQYLKKVPSIYFEFPLKVKSGDVIWLGQTSSLIIKQDTVKGFHLVARDITEFKKVDEELKKSYKEIIARQNAMFNLSEDLLKEVEERKAAEEKIREYSIQLRHLASQMSLLEEQERYRIANMLHDSIGQNLALSKILLDELQAANPSGPLSLSLDELNKIIDEAINSTRNLTFEISSPILYELGLEAAIEWLGEKLLRRHNILFDFRNDRTPKPLTKEAQVLLFQAVREFYLNIIKHSKAHHVRAIIQKLGSDMHISIEDDGIGFDTKTLFSQGSESLTYGLFSARERITLIGGRFGIESTPGQGTSVVLIAPLAA